MSSVSSRSTALILGPVGAPSTLPRLMLGQFGNISCRKFLCEGLNVDCGDFGDVGQVCSAISLVTHEAADSVTIKAVLDKDNLASSAE